jgi:5'-phosphate synthase pdxT subunit
MHQGPPDPREGYRVGILALQGGFLEHNLALHRLGVRAKEVRLPQDFEGLQGLIIPGGESTTIASLIDHYDLREPIIRHAQEGMAVWGTCAGMILVAKSLKEDRPVPLGLMDIVVSRNAFGRQVDSFEREIDVEGLEGGPFHAVFIRAPSVLDVGSDVRVLARLGDGIPVAMQQKRFLCTAFHPELTSDSRLHTYFLTMLERTSEV